MILDLSPIHSNLMSEGSTPLVALNAEDVYLTGNPQITFFSTLKHTMFDPDRIETIKRHDMQFGRTVRMPSFPSNGDLWMTPTYTFHLDPEGGEPYMTYENKIGNHTGSGLSLGFHHSRTINKVDNDGVTWKEKFSTVMRDLEWTFIIHRNLKELPAKRSSLEPWNSRWMKFSWDVCAICNNEDTFMAWAVDRWFCPSCQPNLFLNRDFYEIGIATDPDEYTGAFMYGGKREVAKFMKKNKPAPIDFKVMRRKIRNLNGI